MTGFQDSFRQLTKLAVFKENPERVDQERAYEQRGEVAAALFHWLQHLFPVHALLLVLLHNQGQAVRGRYHSFAARSGHVVQDERGRQCDASVHQGPQGEVSPIRDGLGGDSEAAG